MKKILPKTAFNPSGFTLIELLVVITIIAILATVGIVLYSGVSARGRDAKRMQEIDAIQKAMEKNYAPGVGYSALKDSDFTNLVAPVDPLNGQTKCSGAICKYCSKSSAGACAAADNTVSGGGTPYPAAGTSYTVCANLETAAGVGGNTYYCKSNAF